MYKIVRIFDKKLQLFTKSLSCKFRVLCCTSIIKCDTIFALLSLEKVCAYARGIDSKKTVPGSHCMQGMWLIPRSREKEYIYFVRFLTI